MTIKEAKLISGTLSEPDKMPGYAYSIPAKRCIIGSKLMPIENSVCHVCYAMKWRYRATKTIDAMDYRFKSLDHPQWVDAIVTLIESKQRIQERKRHEKCNKARSTPRRREVLQVA